MKTERARPPARSEEAALPTVASRYRLEALLTQEGMSEVYRALDVVTGDRVAVKLLPDRADAPQLRAEVSALRLLHLPGVARLLDEGEHEGRPFLTTELIAGEPFPGRFGRESGATERPRAWREVRDTVVALLEILARVHARGVVHRDLKPDNVLVDEHGRPTVLDFGLSSGSAIGSGLDPDQSAVGTPAYASPEQICGEPVDARADLYAVGVMLYEALSGRSPQEGLVPDEFLQARLHEIPDPLARHAPDAPAIVCELVDRLLARDPARRPRSAVDVLWHLRGGALRGAGPELPWLGGTAQLERVTRVRSGAVDVVGPAGAGKSRFLAELARALRKTGRTVRELAPTQEPLGTLAELVGEEVTRAGSIDAALEVALERVAAELERGIALLVDDWDRLDRWTARVLEEAVAARPSAAGLVVRARGAAKGDTETVVDLARLREVDLRALFQGPDRLFHLREDGARELWRRTDGHPGRITDEIAAWVRAGLARWSGSTLAVDRRVLGRMRMGLEVLPRERSSAERGIDLGANLEEHLAWVALGAPNASPELLARARELPVWRIEAEQVELVEAGALRRVGPRAVEVTLHPLALDAWSDAERADAHGRIADLLEPGAEGRLLHLVSAGRFEDVPEEACAVADRLLVEGKLGEAEAALTEGLHALRVADARGAELPLFRAWIAVALADFTPQAVDRVLYELSRLDERDDPEIDQLIRFARAALSTLEGTGERALAEVEAVEPFADLELERWRQALRVQAARGAAPEREVEVLEEIGAWVARHPEPFVEASYAEWMGRLRYRQDRFLDAAQHFERAVELGVRVHAQLSAMLNGASALMEACRFERAIGLASEARELAAFCRHTLFEVRAEWILRSAAYRGGSAGAPDLELVRAASRVGVADQEALVCLTEAAVAWRGGNREAAVELANRAAASWAAHGKVWGAALARSLAITAGAPASGEVEELLERLTECPEAYLAGQCYALLSMAGIPVPREAALVARRSGVQIPKDQWGARREVLSMDEVSAALTG